MFDLGDHVDRFHPISEATFGKANVELLNRLQYDAATIGNNEGITLPHQELDTLYDNAQFLSLFPICLTKKGRGPAGQHRMCSKR